MAVQHHFIVFGVENEDGTFEFSFDDDAATFWEGTLYDTEKQEWRPLSSRDDLTDAVEDWNRDMRICGELCRRIT